jgi:hypothetical protein
MSNGALQHVTEIHQRENNTLEVYVQTDSFKAGREVEVSGYLIQGSYAYVAFNQKKYIPLDANGTSVLHVQLPAMDLDPEEPVTVVTRVAEVWPTVLGQTGITPEYTNKGLKAVWTAIPWGKESGGPASPPPSDGGSGGTTSQQP